MFEKLSEENEYQGFVEQTLKQLRQVFPQVKLKSEAEFRIFLDDLLPKLIHKYLIRSGTMKNCSGISSDFSEIAGSAGFPVLTQHVPGHQRNVVLTNEGPLMVDLSYIQFSCNHDWSDKNNQDEVIKNYLTIYQDPWKAIKIEKLPKIPIGSFTLPTADYSEGNPNPMTAITEYNIQEVEEDFPSRFEKLKNYLQPKNAQFSASTDQMPSSLLPVIPSDSRDYHRPRGSFISSTTPLGMPDLHSAEDLPIESKDESMAADGAIYQFQKWLQAGSSGVKYAGPVDGKLNPELLESAHQLEAHLEKKYPGQKFQGSLVSNDNIQRSNIAETLDRVKKLKNPNAEESKPSDPTQTIEEFQKFFSLPETGEVDSILIQKAQAVEQLLSKKTNQSAAGLLWNSQSKTFNTTVSDLRSALKLLENLPK